MADKPTDSVRRDKTAKTSKSSLDRPKTERSAAAVATPPPEVPRQPFFTPNVVWALVAGLAIGFAVGREAYRFGGANSAMTQAAPETSAFIAAESAPSGTKGYTSEAEFPAGWVKSADLTNADTILAGLDAAQKTKVMQALNERDCTCGCPFGRLATCLQKDPNCPNSPAIAKMAAGLAKQGKSLDEILAAIDDRQSSNKKPQAAPEAPKGPQYIEVTEFNMRKGAKEPKVMVVEFSDFQCPFCKRAVPILEQMEKQYGNDVAIVFKHQPLPFHDKAMGAAMAVQAATRQKKGWAMHDKCFENNTALTRDDLDKYAKDIGLDMTKFKKDMDDPVLKQQVEADAKIANAVGASGTPTFFVNGRILVGAQPFEKFEELIKEEIKQADALIAAGTPKSEIYKKRASTQ